MMMNYLSFLLHIGKQLNIRISKTFYFGANDITCKFWHNGVVNFSCSFVAASVVVWEIIGSLRIKGFLCEDDCRHPEELIAEA